jgi:polysaccharide pyruvyl transferase WcaK-like protein
MKISIVGWYGMKNVGDEAFRFVLPQFFEGHEIEFVTPPNHPNNPDIVILGGGAVAAPFYLSVLPDCPRYALGIDIAYESEIDLLAEANFKGVFVRNSSDITTMQKKLSCPVEAIPDLAFLLKPSGKDVLGKYKKTNQKTLGILVTDYVNPAIDRPVEEFAQRAFDFKLKMAAELDVLTSEGYEIVMIPCATSGYGDDRRINLDIGAFMKRQPTQIFDTLDPQQMIDLIAQLDGTICQRFHAHIFSMIAGVPFISLEFTRKVKLLLNENNLQHTTGASFHGETFDASRLRETLGVVLADTRPATYGRLAANYHSHLTRIIQQVRREWLPASS